MIFFHVKIHFVILVLEYDLFGHRPYITAKQYRGVLRGRSPTIGDPFFREAYDHNSKESLYQNWVARQPVSDLLSCTKRFWRRVVRRCSFGEEASTVQEGSAEEVPPRTLLSPLRVTEGKEVEYQRLIDDESKKLMDTVLAPRYQLHKSSSSVCPGMLHVCLYRVYM